MVWGYKNGVPYTSSTHLVWIGDDEGFKGLQRDYPGRDGRANVLTKKRSQRNVLPFLWKMHTYTLTHTHSLSLSLSLSLTHTHTRTHTHTCMSRALQSFMRTRPKMWSWASDIGIGSPSLFPGPTKNACNHDNQLVPLPLIGLCYGTCMLYIPFPVRCPLVCMVQTLVASLCIICV